MRVPIRHGGGVRLSELLAGIVTYPAAPDRRRITGLAMDSRQVQAGDCFLACQGTLQHGREYIDQALKLGAGAVLIEADHPLTSTSSIGAVPWIAVPDLRAQAGIIADRFYGHPSAALLVIGVTGTNGKTSISHFIAQAIPRGEGPVAYSAPWGMGYCPDSNRRQRLRPIPSPFTAYWPSCGIGRRAR
jgi:UDP-N-acetylmuramoyl-L-alanyl-D-glutamate--2,6-diaminopimelate ligase